LHVTHCFRRSPRNSARVSVIAAALVVAGVSSSVRAQPLDHGFVDPCTVDNVQEMYTVCEMCVVPASDPAACTNRLGKLGYEKKCRTVGDHRGYAEAWCIAQGKAPAASAAPAGNAAPSLAPSKHWLLLGIPVLFGAVVLVQRVRARRLPKK
jgi:hypothetical protein